MRPATNSVPRATVPYVTLTLAAIALVAQWLAPLSSSESWFWQTVMSQLQTEQVWRNVTGHFLHTDLYHLWQNVIALLILGSIIEQWSVRHLLGAFGIGIIGVCLWFYAVSGSLYYCGLSGALYAVLVVAMAHLWQPLHQARDKRERTLIAAANAIVLCILFGALVKSGLESQLNMNFTVKLQWISAPGAHIAGWISGMLYVMSLVLFQLAKEEAPRLAQCKA